MHWPMNLDVMIMLSFAGLKCLHCYNTSMNLDVMIIFSPVLTCWFKVSALI